MILSAGLGSRLRPLTDTTPKPLIKVGDKPLIVWHIENLARNGFKEIVINIAHLGYMLPEQLGNGSTWNVKLHYSDEQKIGALESAGGINKALQFLGHETFLVVNADIFCEYEYNANFQLPQDKLAHLILVKNPPHNPNGDFFLEDDLASDTLQKKYTFSGIGYYSYKLFDTLKEGEKAPLAPLLRDAIKHKKIDVSLYHGLWHDIGTPQRLNEINKRFQ
jgi:MurNAc alpha-1-phosphate uridylyltransferase